MKKWREWKHFQVEGLRVYKVTMRCCNIQLSDYSLVAAASPTEAIRILKAEKKMMNHNFSSSDYEFTAERATVLRPFKYPEATQ